MKKCTKCKILLPLTSYNKNKYSKDGHEYRCKKCRAEDRKPRAAKNRIYQIEWHSRNIENVKLYKNKNKEKIKKYNKSWNLRNAEHVKNYRKNYNKNNRPKINKIKQEYYHRVGKENRKLNLNRRLLDSLRSRVRSAIVNNCGNKAYKTIELIGCTVPELKIHLEKQFKPGMSWNNYGMRGWHIDHIIPCAYFDLKNIEEQKICFNYKNLQPLWAIDNLQKGALLPNNLK